MERLTERDEYGNADIIALSDMMPELYAQLSYSETNALTDTLNKLAAYEEAEDEGRLIKLPCKVGDTMWCEIDHTSRNRWFITTGVYKCVVDNFEINKYGTYANITITRKREWHLEPDTYKLCVRTDTIFLTREAAEKALKERESE